MRNLLFIICILIAPVAYAGDYDLCPVDLGSVEVVEPVEPVAPVEPVEPIQNDLDGMIVLEDLEELEELEEVIDGTKETLEYWKDIYLYLSQGLGIGFLSFLSRAAYLYYQTKRGQLFVKHVKNNAVDIQEDIIDSIEKIINVETAEGARVKLEEINSKLLEIAKKKLPPKP